MLNAMPIPQLLPLQQDTLKALLRLQYGCIKALLLNAMPIPPLLP
jgi:hypothetical protein